MAEHSTADREVAGSTPAAPCFMFCFNPYMLKNHGKKPIIIQLHRNPTLCCKELCLDDFGLLCEIMIPEILGQIRLTGSLVLKKP